MNTVISQFKFSPRVSHFEEGFKERWNLRPYDNPDDPCVFVGIYDEEDIVAIKKHKGYKVLLPTGTLDLNKNQEYINDLFNDKKMFFIKCWWASYPASKRVKSIKVPIKDYSLFEPNPLGDKVYCYLGVSRNKHEYGYELAEWLKKQIPYEIIYGYRDPEIDLPIEKLKEQYYDKTFVNLNLSTSKVGGFTSVNELAFMGRKSITTSTRREKFLINFRKKESIIKIIEKESSKIGTIQPNLMEGHFIGDEWLDINFWKN